jgi:hypothetical protein
MQRPPELGDAVQDLSEALDRRLLLIDETMQTVAYSIHETARDRERLSHSLAHSATWPRPRTAQATSSVEDLPEIGPTLFVRLLDSNQYIIGHLVVSLTDAEEQTGRVSTSVVDRAIRGAAQLGELMEAWLQNTDAVSLRTQQLTINLVNGNAQQRAEAAEALLTEQLLSTSEVYCAVALGLDPRWPEHSQEKAALAVSRTIHFVRETSTATVVGGTLDDGVGILVFPRPVVVPRLTRILEESPLDHVRAGVGPLSTLENVHQSFKRARAAWRVTCLAPDEYPIVITSDESGLDGLLARLPLEDFTVEDLPLSTRELLAAVDSPALLETLDSYLAAGGDAQQTARNLTIHRSTLYYRLDKISMAISGDLRDGIVRRDLHTGLRIAKLAGLI